MSSELTPDVITAVAASALSILATYVPGFNTWHARQSTEAKKLIWATTLLAVAAGAVAWGCSPEAGCVTNTWQEYAGTYLAALMLGVGANQGTHLLLPEPAAVKEAKLEGKLRRGTG